jgi:hypothetical protein
LAGFDIAEMGEANVNNFLHALLLRYAFIKSDKVKDLVIQQISEVANKIMVTHPEYAINEMLYEYRLALGTNEAFEKAVLKNWTAKIISKMGPDAGLDLFNVVTINRKNRRR